MLFFSSNYVPSSRNVSLAASPRPVGVDQRRAKIPARRFAPIATMRHLCHLTTLDTETYNARKRLLIHLNGKNASCGL
jgi:hypothetical protein